MIISYCWIVIIYTIVIYYITVYKHTQYKTYIPITILLYIGGGSGGMPKGISFNVDTQDKRMSRIYGNGIKLDMDVVEIVTSGGKLKYSPTHIEFVSY